ncbi:hypothetical protein Y032_0177g607 [Ancylostoma ceylanicum]|nr:hypothetical protein Y032_0177g607 [Ancylostoma ceylanicum]
MINVNGTHPMRLPASIIDRRSAGRPVENRQQGAASRTMRCGYRTLRNIQTNTPWFVVLEGIPVLGAGSRRVFFEAAEGQPPSTPTVTCLEKSNKVMNKDQVLSIKAGILLHMKGSNTARRHFQKIRFRPAARGERPEDRPYLGPCSVFV